ncbi:hypothetical protein [Paenibacillus antibioticophila]|uniref:hypothetical protein n=1 Tax=Paenibacillus antibioticophila TaxID=1274374 RepID=UPI0005C89749|nr:hypothetical protein [Paenibacillus antibioticophila]
MDNDTFYKGRYPKYANEIGISGAISKELGKGIGDQVTVNIQYRKELSRKFVKSNAQGCGVLYEISATPAWWTVPCRIFVRKFA